MYRSGRAGTPGQRPVRDRGPVAGRLPVRGRAPRRADPEPRPARRRRRLLPASFRPGRAVRAEPGGALHRHVPDEPPVRPERHPARRPAHERRARRPRASATSPRSSATPTPASIPGPSRPTTPASSATRACSPASTRCATCPRWTPSRGWSSCASTASTWATSGISFADAPNAEHTMAHQLRDRAQPDDVPDRRAHRLHRRIRVPRPWFAHLSLLRPHPPFLAPAPYDTMYDPATVPDAGARAVAPRKARNTRCSA